MGAGLSENDETNRDPPTVYQVPVKTEDDEPIRINFKRTIVDGVRREQLADLCEIPLEHETLRVWGNTEDEPADTGDYLLFADRDGRHGGDYTHLARIDHATILDEETAAAFTNAIGWGEVSDVSYQHVMFLDPIYETTLDREGFWETLGFRGWPNDTFSGIDFGRSGSTFFAEYDSIEAFLEQIRGNKIYPTELAVETESADEYETLEAAITDIRSRLEESSENTSWLKTRLGGSTRRRVVCFTHWIQTVRYRLHEHCYNVRSTSIRLRVTRTRTRGDCRRNRCRLSLFVFAGKDALSLLGSHSSGGSRRYRECLESTSAEQYSSRYLHRGD